MFLKKILSIKDTLAFRLTGWYAGIFTLSALLAFLAFYVLTASVISEDRDEDLIGDLKEFSAILSDVGMTGIKREMSLEVVSEGVDQIFLRLFTTDGEVLASTDMFPWPGVVFDSKAMTEQLKNGVRYVLSTQLFPDGDRQARIITGMVGPDLILQIGESVEEDEEFLEIFQNIFIPIMGIVILIAAATGWFIAGRALTGIDEVAQTASRIIKGDYTHRVSIKNRGLEIETLAKTFNSMLDRINAVFRQMKDTNDNIAHDLRTPLSRIGGAAEMALTTRITDEENKAAAAGIVEECDRLLGMINTMLDIAEAEAGVADMKWHTVDLAELLFSACELFEPLANKNTVKMEVKSAPGCLIRGESRMLQRMISNLLDNALKYTPSGGTVSISAAPENNRIFIIIEDSGTGVSEKDLPYIFNRFYRCDQSRTLPGSGLGLSLVKAIVVSHSGTIDVESTPEKGSRFTVSFSRASIIGKT
jgi:heavy metal sensor kinase